MVGLMGYRPPKKEEDEESDAAKEVWPPPEPNGYDLSEKRNRQAHSKKWAQHTYDEIAQALHDEQRKQKYVDEPKRKRRHADGD